MGYVQLSPTTMLAPLPCALVSCRGRETKPNMLTVAWSGIACTHPPMISISVKPGRFSHELILDSGELCVHPVDAKHVKELDLCGIRSGRDVDKFQATGLRAIPSGLKYAPAVEGLPVCLACEVRQCVPLGSHDLFLSEIRHVLIREDLLDADGSVHLERAALVAYSHGLYQELGRVLGFFGFSVARKEVYQKRMNDIRKVSAKQGPMQASRTSPGSHHT